MLGNKKEQSDPGPGDWRLEVYDRPDGSIPYNVFLKSLDPYSQIVLGISVEEVLARQGHNICNTSWGKALRDGLYEFRVQKSLNALCKEACVPVPGGLHGDKGVSLRVFFTVEGVRIVLLLGGYDKGKDPNEKRQDREIKVARKLLKEHRANERKKAKHR